MAALLANDVAVVTGGASGIGREISLRLAEHGADVVVADRLTAPWEGGTPTHERVEADHGRQAAYVACDVTRVEELEAAMSAAADL